MTLHKMTSDGGVFPVLVTGLHCGATRTDTGNPASVVFPVLVTGLHCGT